MLAIKQEKHYRNQLKIILLTLFVQYLDGVSYSLLGKVYKELFFVFLSYNLRIFHRKNKNLTSAIYRKMLVTVNILKFKTQKMFSVKMFVTEIMFVKNVCKCLSQKICW